MRIGLLALCLAGCGGGVVEDFEAGGVVPAPPMFRISAGQWSPRFEVGAGKEYAFSVRHREAGAPETLALYVAWYGDDANATDEAAGLISAYGVSVPAAAEWSVFSANGLAPESARYGRVFVLADGPAPHAVFVDWVRAVRAEP